MTSERSSFEAEGVRARRARASGSCAVKRYRFVVVAAAALLASVPVAAGAPDPAAEVAARAAGLGLAPQPLLAPVQEARRLGLPAEPVANKVLEGLAKGVGAERVAAVAAALVSRMAQADAVLAAARAAGLAPAPDRPAALADLAQAIQAGVDRSSLETLLTAAGQAHSGSGAVVDAARALGELSRRGVPPAEALALGQALAARPGEASQVVALFDVWRAEGGRDPEAFLSEAERRVATGRPLKDMVDRFGESPDRITRQAASRREDKGALGDPGRRGSDSGLAPGERSDAARGAVPGLDDAARKGKKP